MKPFGIPALLLGAAFASFMALRGAKRKSLSPSGAVAAWIVGFSIVSCGLRGFVLVWFYFIATKATKFHIDDKNKLDASVAEGSVRGPSQVFCASILAVFLSLIHAYYCGEEEPINFETEPMASQLSCAVLAHHATCLADTLGSEMGILSNQPPILVTRPWKRVPAGTNGGVTAWGTLWSGIGGALMGVCTVLMDVFSGISPLQPTKMVLYGTICGLLGSFVDSLLGATLQASYWDPETKLSYQSDKCPPSAKHISGIDLLSNAQVNLASVVVMTFAGGYIIGPLVFQ